MDTPLITAKNSEQRKDEKHCLLIENQCAKMEPQSPQHIIASTATKHLELAGGSTMEQILPEEYTLANFILRALEERNGQELEFVLKSYLRIRVVPIENEENCFLVEPIGFTSAHFKLLNELTLTTILEEMKNAKTLDELLQLIRQSQDAIKTLVEVDETVLLGIMSKTQASEILALLECPTRPELEAYAITYPEVLESKDLECRMKQLKSTIEIKSMIDAQLKLLHQILVESMTRVLSEEEAIIEKQTDQLDRRIESLLHKIDEMDLEEDTDEVLQKRRQALTRDQNRRRSILSQFEEKSQLILKGNESIERSIEQNTQILADLDDSLKEILIPTGSTDFSLPWTILLIPFIVVGFSKKGRLKVTIYPPSKLNEVDTRVGIRRDFIDTLSEASEYLSKIALQLTKLANSDVNMRKYLRESSKNYNLLSLKESRVLIRDGVKALLADGLVKESQISELDSILHGFSEQRIKVQKSIKIKPISLEAGKGQCHVKFHIYDDHSKPIDSAKLDLGGMVLQTDLRGSAEVNLTKSRYEAKVSAIGFKEKTIEFRLDSSDDVVIPITLNPLPTEERLALELEKLLERAKRLDIIRNRLWQAFQKQGDTLLSIPAYRGILVELLTELGYEAESWISEARTERGMVKRLLKRDDRENALRRDILRLAETSKASGGLMLFSDLLLHLDKMGWATSFDEVETTLNEMTREGLIEGVSVLEDGTRLVKFIPVALTNDPQKILNLAATSAGQLTIEDAVLKLGWNEERVMNALSLLVDKGVAKIQKTYSKSTIYWFPGLQEKRE